jgi:streptomycin 6-kinase
VTDPALHLAPRLVESCARTEAGRAWLEALPAEVAACMRRWGLRFEPEGGGAGASCSFIAFVRRADGSPAVLKLGLPHMEAEHELWGLRVWDGDGAIRVLAADAASGAMLLERCEPGEPLSLRPEPEQDEVIAALLAQLWRAPPPGHPFRPLGDMARYWADVQRARRSEWPDAGLVEAGITLFLELAAPAPGDVLLTTDLHAGNVLRARRSAWLAIDPKPFVGDRTYDITQHLLNCIPRLSRDPRGTVARVAELSQLESERVERWMLARLCISARTGANIYGMSGAEALNLARRIARNVA